MKAGSSMVMKTTRRENVVINRARCDVRRPFEHNISIEVYSINNTSQ